MSVAAKAQLSTVRPMNIVESTRDYEKWLAEQTDVVKTDLRYKHTEMRSSPFSFMRATFYRWTQLWDEHCTELRPAPKVLGVGDLHVENFGTWRDSEGRLIWGVNDFDEACHVPYTNDLVRLTTSVHLAIRNDHLTIGRREAANLILQGYKDTLQSGGRPFVLGEEHVFLRNVALAELRDPVHFWHNMRSLPEFEGSISADQRDALELLLPKPVTKYEVRTRRAGLGSLGRVRLVALSEWHGALLAREIKAFLPSAWNRHHSLYPEIITKAVLVPDPFVRIHDKWIVRRLASDCSRIELKTLPRKRDEARILHSMGSETANIHLGTHEATKQVLRDLERRPASWLHNAAKIMSAALIADWKVFKRA
jgi:hypothetical protein